MSGGSKALTKDKIDAGPLRRPGVACTPDSAVRAQQPQKGQASGVLQRVVVAVSLEWQLKVAGQLGREGGGWKIPCCTASRRLHYGIRLRWLLGHRGQVVCRKWIPRRPGPHGDWPMDALRPPKFINGERSAISRPCPLF